MKNAVKSRLLFALSLFVAVALVPAAVFGAPKKKKKSGGSEISCAEIWNGAAEKFYGKTVKTFVLGIGAAGTAPAGARKSLRGKVTKRRFSASRKSGKSPGARRRNFVGSSRFSTVGSAARSA